MTTPLTTIPIIDTDTHVVEPPDLWTSRVASKWGDLVPHVEWDDAAHLYLGLTALDRQLPADARRRDGLRDLARWLRGSFPSGADSPTNFKPLEKPTLEDRLFDLRKLAQ